MKGARSQASGIRSAHFAKTEKEHQPLRLPRIEELSGNGQLIAIARVDGELATFFKAALDLAEDADFRLARVAAEGVAQRLRELELDSRCDEAGVVNAPDQRLGDRTI